MVCRKPYHSVNFVTAHDGFSLRDLVSYNDKHNKANGEEGRDGTNDNLSWNCGVEGVTDDAAVNALRWKQMKNFHLALMVAQGTPMVLAGPITLLEGFVIFNICVMRVCPHAAWNGMCTCAWMHQPIAACSCSMQQFCCPRLAISVALQWQVGVGDEYGHSRGGNNNWYGHDNAMTHFKWDADEEEDAFKRFYAAACNFRRECALLGREEFLTPDDITWHERDWENASSKFIAFTLRGRYAPCHPPSFQ